MSVAIAEISNIPDVGFLTDEGGTTVQEDKQPSTFIELLEAMLKDGGIDDVSDARFKDPAVGEALKKFAVVWQGIKELPEDAKDALSHKLIHGDTKDQWVELMFKNSSGKALGRQNPDAI